MLVFYRTQALETASLLGGCVDAAHADLSCTYLAHHELESVIITTATAITITITITVINIINMMIMIMIVIT